MMEKSNDDMNAPEFKQIIAGYTDDELREVLEKRKLYQKEAADFAIQEAIRRGIIYSEQDLFASEFKYEPEKFSIFPIIENEKVRSKYRKSIARSLLIIGVLQMVWGGIKIFDAQSLEGTIVFVFGAVWSLAFFKLMRSVNLKLVYSTMILFALLVVYLVKIMISANSLTTIDILVTAITLGFVLYGIGFLGKLKD